MKSLPMRLDSPYWNRPRTNWARLWKAYARVLHRRNQVLSRDEGIEREDRIFIGFLLAFSVSLNLWWLIVTVARWVAR